jgi:hypothetical protein
MRSSTRRLPRQEITRAEMRTIANFAKQSAIAEAETLARFAIARKTLSFTEAELCMICEAGRDKGLVFLVVAAERGAYQAMSWFLADLGQTISRRRLHERWWLTELQASSLVDRMRARPFGTLALIDSLETFWADEHEDSRTVAEYFRDLGVIVTE